MERYTSLSINPLHPIWHYIDAVVVVNLQHRSDRWQQIQQDLADKVPKEKLHRQEAVYGTSIKGFGARPWFSNRTQEAMSKARAGAAGCLLSHREILIKSEQQDWNIVLHLEDDARLVEQFEQVWQSLVDFIANSSSWDLIYLGHLGSRNKVGTAYNQGEVGVFRLPGVTSTYGFLVHRQARQKLLAQLPNARNIWSWLAMHQAIDTWLANWFSCRNLVFGVEPHLISHNDSYSDIECCEKSWHSDEVQRHIEILPENIFNSYLSKLRRKNFFKYGRKGMRRLITYALFGYAPRR